MSVLYKLNAVQEVRQNKYSQALKKAPLEAASAQKVEAAPAVDPKVQPALKTPAWIFKGILALLVLLVFAVGLLIFLFLRSSFVEKKEIQPKSIQVVKPVTKVKAKARTTTTNKASHHKVSSPNL